MDAHSPKKNEYKYRISKFDLVNTFVQFMYFVQQTNVLTNW